MLSAATATQHQHLDDQLAGYDLGTAQGLEAFLICMARGFASVEQGLERAGVVDHYRDWPTRKRLSHICADLGSEPGSVTGQPIAFNGIAELWGALYVLEGSRLGSRVLAKSAPNSKFLAESAADRYWPAFLTQLEHAGTHLNDNDGLISGARKAFQAFL